ncbi:MAG: hypothetical protein EOM50_12760 [Erysipelotrichia bacterium]|nr:hypothetical protein [Erysipelotrichia bacterium]
MKHASACPMIPEILFCKCSVCSQHIRDLENRKPQSNHQNFCCKISNEKKIEKAEIFDIWVIDVKELYKAIAFVQKARNLSPPKIDAPQISSITSIQQISLDATRDLVQ